MALEFSPAMHVHSCLRHGDPLASRSPRRSMIVALAENNDKPSLSAKGPSSAGVPKLEPFSQSRVSRLVKEPSLLEKAEHAIADRCSILEGDAAYECWEALFEFEHMKHDTKIQCDLAAPSEKARACRSLERLENFVRYSGGVASLINNVRMLAMANKMHKPAMDSPDELQNSQDHAPRNSSTSADDNENVVHFFPEPEDLPPTKEDLELEESARMPDSPFTRVLRVMGRVH
ncbi:hypothetical protein KP509_14G070500 [Ceratopteris richardii]|uniref:Uncharacterized protein n=1 Tax=Ceratopteris richardii TaxID=49495 RepID=A0A8T2TAM6_CERRI|nr:hypothetical protein KP509_14G070500 [Ceratopteris richardii]